MSVLVTGVSRGLGREAAAAMRAAGRDVVAPGRDQLDLGSLGSVRAFAAAIAGPVEAIVCNAGMQSPGRTAFTEDGIELTFQVNHLGHFLLVALLRDRLAPNARVVVVSSGTHDAAQRTGMPKPDYRSARALAHPAPTDSPTEGRRRYTAASSATSSSPTSWPVAARCAPTSSTPGSCPAPAWPATTARCSASSGTGS